MLLRAPRSKESNCVMRIKLNVSVQCVCLAFFVKCWNSRCLCHMGIAVYLWFKGDVMALPTRPLGSSGLNITRVGFGSWAVGGGGWSYGWGPQDDSDSIATMRHALDLGINWIDTAAAYGLGHSEEVVGRLLRELPATQK